MSDTLTLRIIEIKKKLPKPYTQLFVSKFPKYKGKEKLVRELLCFRSMRNNNKLISDLEKFVGNGK